MLLKGLNKQVIVINDTGSELFESAIFFVSPRSSEKKDEDIVAEAQRLIASKLTSRDTARKIRMKTVIGAAATASALTFAATMLLQNFLK